MSTRSPRRPTGRPAEATGTARPAPVAPHPPAGAVALALDRSGTAPALPPDVGAGLRHLGRLSPVATRGVRAAPTVVPPDALVRVTYSDGSTWWRRADELLRDGGRPAAAARGIGSHTSWTIDWQRDPLLGVDAPGGPTAATASAAAKPPPPGAPQSRGVVGVAMQVLDFFGFDVARPVARAAGEALEAQRLGRPAGLYRLGLAAAPDGQPTLTALPADHRVASGRPVLVFLHGTFSSVAGSFGALWNEREQPLGRALREDLRRVYGEEVYAFEHRSLTHSPVRNALDLSRHLPAGAELHLVSHSRGGLVGELLCLGQRIRPQGPLADPLADARLASHFRTAPEAADALRLAELSAADQRERQSALDADLALLRQLRDALAGVRVTRFARVACPAAGTSLAAGRLDRWLNLMLMVMPDGLAAGITEFLLAVLQHRTDPRALPGLEAMMPGSALTQLLRADGLVTEADLTAITGDIDARRRATGGVRFRLARQLASRLADQLFEGDHDFVVNTPSMSGGLRRPPGRSRVRADQGLDVDHFRYFVNAGSFAALRDALFAPDPADPGPAPTGAAAPGTRDIGGPTATTGHARRRRGQAAAAAATPPIEVSIQHGNLAFARHPVLVGHYQGDTIVSAEKALDQRLGGELSRRMALGLYPGPIGSHALFHNRPQRSPSQALVIGLGPVGELSPGLLEAGVRDALLDLALRQLAPGGASAASEAAVEPPAGPLRIGISSLLVGTGAGALKARESIEAILRGAVAANHTLQASSLDDRLRIDRIEFLELYEDIALGAAAALADLLRAGDLAERARWSRPELLAGDGRRQRRRFDEDASWWQRLEILVDADGSRLRFLSTTERARAEETLSDGQLTLADAFVARASASTARDAEVARTLFEMLLPQRLKEAAPEQRDRVLVVDPQSARFPWELLEDRWSQNGLPMAVAAGLVRQLKTPRFRAKPVHTAERSVFIVGDPDLADWAEVPQLPGAQAEAEAVAALFDAQGYAATASINEGAQAILTGLHRAPWRVLHLAGHGVHGYAVTGPVEPDGSNDGSNDGRNGGSSGTGSSTAASPRRRSGMVIGHETFLTPGDVEQLRHVPELVFINCCHLGQTRPAGVGEDLNRLAANLGVQFIEMGVKAVVAAGWAVDDDAALVFAQTFYGQLLSGVTFGVAVRVAREATHRRHPESNTWGAYQCYGDPAYRLSADSPASGPRPVAHFYAPAELVAELQNLREDLRSGGREAGDRADGPPPAQRVEALTGRVPAELLPTWLSRADVAAAVGALWGEVGDYAQAIDWLSRALAAPVGDCPVRAAEQLANFQVRLAAATWQVSRDSGGRDSAARDSAGRETPRVKPPARARARPSDPASKTGAPPVAPTPDPTATARASIEAALQELERLCRHGATEERHNLLASACKRLAWVCVDDSPACRAALTRVRSHSEAALALHAQQHGGAVSPYAFTNWALAGLLLDGPAAPAARGWRADLDARCEAGIARARADDAASPSVWSASAQADLALVQLLHLGATVGRRARGGANDSAAARLAELGGVAAAAYARAFSRAASARERLSVVENLGYLIALTTAAAWPAATVAALQRLRDALA